MRVLHFARTFYLDDSNGASTANRALLESLVRHDLDVEVLSGTIVDAVVSDNPFEALRIRRLDFELVGGDDFMVGPDGIFATNPCRLRYDLSGVKATLHHRPFDRYDTSTASDARELLALLDATLDRFRPDVLLSYGGDPQTLEALVRCRRRGVKTVFTLHNFGYSHAGPFVDVDAVLVASRFSAEHYRDTLGLECVVLPYIVPFERIVAETSNPCYVTFVNPSFEKGVYAFARIADELGRRRPDIPILVVETRGSEETLVGCGIDLRGHANVFLMTQTPDPRDFWGVTKVCLLPSLWWENQPLVAVEAMANGIPVIGSDRGGIPETLGDAGIVLPLPDRLTPASRVVPTAQEVEPWVEAVIRLWDDREFYEDHRSRAKEESKRWAPEVVEPRYVDFFEGLCDGRVPSRLGPAAKG